METVPGWAMIVLPAFLAAVSFLGWKKFRYPAYAFFVVGWGVVSAAQSLLVTGLIK